MPSIPLQTDRHSLLVRPSYLHPARPARQIPTASRSVATAPARRYLVPFVITSPPHGCRWIAPIRETGSLASPFVCLHRDPRWSVGVGAWQHRFAHRASYGWAVPVCLHGGRGRSNTCAHHAPKSPGSSSMTDAIRLPARLRAFLTIPNVFTISINRSPLDLTETSRSRYLLL